MKIALKNNPSADTEAGQFSLPFSDERISVDLAGDRKLARIACEMAGQYSSPVESDKQYANRLATFICGYIACQCDNVDEQMRPFNDFLKMVYGLLNRGCSENEAGTDEIVKADYLDNRSI